MALIRSRFVALACGFLMLLGAVSCGGAGSESGSGGGKKQGGTLTILAASSLIDAFGELGKTFEKQNEGVAVKQSFESSSTLLTQIQQGAPADVFASAATEEMDTAVDDGLVAGKPQ
ncbi:MAG TPA: molybdate ABC transporter substrate-binding protein, partial [Rubrobacter sp.]|nr:molybdate ABC transporter substrate-binding protein [Rubrobacter sp.]